MKTIYILAIGLVTAAVTSCNSGIDQKEKQTTSVQPGGSLTKLPTTNAAVPVNSTDSNKGAITVTPTESANAVLNPAHGQPGHSCGIAVGAPLSGTATNSITGAVPTSTAPPNIQSQNLIMNNSQLKPAASNPKPTVGLNPAHGQPGHKCDISVGAPLNK